MGMRADSGVEAQERVKARIMAVKGVIGVAELNGKQKETVALLEGEAMKNVLGGMGRGNNAGLVEALNCEVVMVFFVNMLFEMPKDANMMLLMCNGQVSGWAAMDPDLIKKFKEDKSYIVLSDFFVIRRDAKLSKDSFACGESCFVFNGTQIEEFFKISEMTDHIVAIPSPPGFNFLYEQFKERMDLSDPKIGGFILGFNAKPRHKLT
jgi:hypothetical protein